VVDVDEEVGMQSANAELIRRWNQQNQDPSAVRELVSPDFVAHLEDGDVHGPDGWVEFTRREDIRLRDVHSGIDELIESGPFIGERWWLRGITEDGQPMLLRGITMHRVADGRLQEDWVAVELEQDQELSHAGPRRTAVTGL
jgi:hypothetical protein